jgi:hypothetical protein
MSLKKYMRVSKSPEDKTAHLKKLVEVLSSPHWQEVLEEMEDILIKAYESLEDCKTFEDFIALQAEVIALKKLAGLSGLTKTVAFRRQRIRPPE